MELTNLKNRTLTALTRLDLLRAQMDLLRYEMTELADELVRLRPNHVPEDHRVRVSARENTLDFVPLGLVRAGGVDPARQR